MWWGVLQNQRKRPKILIKYVAVHPTVVSENYSSSGMLKKNIVSWKNIAHSIYIVYTFMQFIK